MKKLFFAATLLATAFAIGQNTFPASGNVGIGTSTPTELLHINGAMRWGNSILTHDQGGSISLRGTGTSTPYIDFYRNYNAATPWAFDTRLIMPDANRLELIGGTFVCGEGYELIHSTYGAGFGSKIYAADQGSGKTAFKIAVRANSATWTDVLFINAGINNGYVGLGTANPDERLTVKGKIHSEEVKVDLLVPADYVFEKYYTGTSALKADYVMPTLAEVESFTKANNHLPNIPSAQEIKENGLQLGEMTNLLLQKIEELTLYSIEQQKRIEALESKLNDK